MGLYFFTLFSPSLHSFITSFSHTRERHTLNTLPTSFWILSLLPFSISSFILSLPPSIHPSLLSYPLEKQAHSLLPSSRSLPLSCPPSLQHGKNKHAHSFLFPFYLCLKKEEEEERHLTLISPSLLFHSFISPSSLPFILPSPRCSQRDEKTKHFLSSLFTLHSTPIGSVAAQTWWWLLLLLLHHHIFLTLCPCSPFKAS